MIDMTKRRDVLVGLCALLGMGVQTVASAQAPSTAPKIAVTDLAYSERVSEYFDVTSIKAAPVAAMLASRLKRAIGK